MYDYYNKSNRKQVKETVWIWSQNWLLPAILPWSEGSWSSGYSRMALTLAIFWDLSASLLPPALIIASPTGGCWLLLDAKLSTLKFTRCQPVMQYLWQNGTGASLSSRLPGARRYCHGIIRPGLSSPLRWALQTFPDGCVKVFSLCSALTLPKAHITCSQESRLSSTGWVNEGLPGPFQLAPWSFACWYFFSFRWCSLPTFLCYPCHHQPLSSFSPAVNKFREQNPSSCFGKNMLELDCCFVF